MPLLKGRFRSAKPTIDADFPGGNIVVERIKGKHVYLRPDQRDTRGSWFYWHFRVRRAAARRLVFHFSGGKVVGVHGPAASTDGGTSWQWLGDDRVFAYSFPADAGEVRFCVAVPYQEADLKKFLARHAGSAHLKVETLAVTRKGRNVERLHLGKLDGPPQHRVLLTCRHHACEMMAAWVLEGIFEAVLAEGDDGRWLRERVEFLAVPFVDKDGVEDGDQGKKRSPHDHNRDYLGESIYPEVAALKEFVPAWSDGRLRLALDLHCPNLVGGGDEPGSSERIHFVGSPAEQSERNLVEFCTILERVQTGPLRFCRRHNLLWGQSWNTAEKPRSCSRWADQLGGVLFAAVLETPYADVAGQAVTAETARLLGHDVARALRRFLEEQAGT